VGADLEDIITAKRSKMGIDSSRAPVEPGYGVSDNRCSEKQSLNTKRQYTVKENAVWGVYV